MKILYASLSRGCCVLVLSILSVSCSSTLSYNDAMSKNVRNIENPEKLEDAKFLMEAASYNILATKMAEAAIESGYSASVVSMARHNLEEHQDMNKELSKLARKEDIKLPAEMNANHERILSELTATDRRQFDRAYTRLLSKIATEDSDKFAVMATQAQSEEVRAFAARKLDLFKAHQQQIETVDAELLQTY